MRLYSSHRRVKHKGGLNSQSRGQVRQVLHSHVKQAGSDAPQLISFQVCTISTFSDIAIRLGKEPRWHVLQGKAHTTHSASMKLCLKLTWWVICSMAYMSLPQPGWEISQAVLQPLGKENINVYICVYTLKKKITFLQIKFPCHHVLFCL